MERKTGAKDQQKDQQRVSGHAYNTLYQFLTSGLAAGNRTVTSRLRLQIASRRIMTRFVVGPETICEPRCSAACDQRPEHRPQHRDRHHGGDDVHDGRGDEHRMPASAFRRDKTCDRDQ
jgi:hypothetical protein